MDTKSFNEYESTKSHASDLKRAFSDIRNNLPNTDAYVQILKNLQIQHGMDKDYFSNYLDVANGLAEHFLKFDELNSNYNAIEIRKQRAERKAERRDIWILWFQRTARWAAGILLFVLLYSLCVFASEKTNFIKIPVRDVITLDSSNPANHSELIEENPLESMSSAK